MKARITAFLFIQMWLFSIFGATTKTAPQEIIEQEPGETIMDITDIHIDDDTYTEDMLTVPKEPTPLPDEPDISPDENTQHNDANIGVTEPEPGTPDSLGVFTLTAYCSCYECCGEYSLNRPVDEYGNEIVYGSIGVRLEAGVSIAVDPRVIPYGSKVVINGHTYIAQDTGGGIKGNRIDVYFDDHQEALIFGVQDAEVFIYW